MAQSRRGPLKINETGLEAPFPAPCHTRSGSFLWLRAVFARSRDRIRPNSNHFSGKRSYLRASIEKERGEGGLSAPIQRNKMGRNGENKGTGRARWSNKSGDRYQIPSFSPHFSPRLYTATFFSRRLLSFNRSNPPPPRVGCLSVNFCVKRTLKVDRRAPRAFPRRHKQQRSQFQREQSAEVQTTSVGYHFGNVNSASGLSCSQVIIVLMFSIILSAAFIVTINSYMGLIIEKFDEWSVNNRKVMNYELFVRKQYVFIFFPHSKSMTRIHNDRQIKFRNVPLFVTKSKIRNEWMVQKLHSFF